MAERLSAIDDVVEGVVLTVTAVPNEPYLQLLLDGLGGTPGSRPLA